MEKKLGDTVRLLSEIQPANASSNARGAIDAAAQRSGGASRYAILGVPEDIGPRANCGRGGAHSAYDAFLPMFLNMQSNASLPGDTVIMLGHVFCEDLLLASRGAEASVLRTLVAQLDERVEEVSRAVFEAGMELIVVGGGHNNCLPILRAAHAAGGAPVAACNLDPHGDIRSTTEGRHSGNGFSLALEEGALGWYYLCGYHSRYNSASALETLSAYSDVGRARAACFEDWLDGDGGVDSGLMRALADAAVFFRGGRRGGGVGSEERSEGARPAEGDSFQPQPMPLPAAAGWGNLPRGVEVDLDAIAGMPTSAASPSGVSVEAARRFVRHLASVPTTVASSSSPLPLSLSSSSSSSSLPVYLHLAEGAPELGGAEGEGARTVGKTLAYLTTDFIECRARLLP